MGAVQLVIQTIWLHYHVLTNMSQSKISEIS